MLYLIQVGRFKPFASEIIANFATDYRKELQAQSEENIMV